MESGPYSKTNHYISACIKHDIIMLEVDAGSFSLDMIIHGSCLLISTVRFTSVVSRTDFLQCKSLRKQVEKLTECCLKIKQPFIKLNLLSTYDNLVNFCWLLSKQKNTVLQYLRVIPFLKTLNTQFNIWGNSSPRVWWRLPVKKLLSLPQYTGECQVSRIYTLSLSAGCT